MNASWRALPSRYGNLDPGAALRNNLRLQFLRFFEKKILPFPVVNLPDHPGEINDFSRLEQARAKLESVNMPVKFCRGFPQEVVEPIVFLFDDEIDVNEIPRPRLHGNGMDFIDCDIQDAIHGQPFIGRAFFYAGKRVIAEINLENFSCREIQLKRVQAQELPIVNLSNLQYFLNFADKRSDRRQVNLLDRKSVV